MKYKQLISFFVPFLNKFKYKITLTFLLVLIGRVIALAVIPLFYKQLIDMVSVQELLSFSSFFTVLLFLFGSLLLVKVIMRANDFIVEKVESLLVLDMNARAYEIIADQDYQFFSNNFVGSLVSKVSKFGRSFYTIYDIIMWQFVGTLGVLGVMVYIVFTENTYLGLIFLGWSVIYFFVSLAISKRQAHYDLIRSKAETKLNGLISDIFTNILNVKIFSTKGVERSSFDEANNYSHETRYSAWHHITSQRVVLALLQVAFEMGMLVMSVYLWSQGEITSGVIVLVLLYSNRIIDQLWFLSESLKRFTTSITDCMEVIEILETPRLVIDPEEPQEPHITQGQVTFNKVSFTYPKGDHVFENFMLEIPAGQSVGLVGKSGSGKTTITKLLLRFFNVDNGSVSIDGQDISTITQDDLRANIAYIPQESILFHRTVYENILYGNLNATKEEVIDAAKKAHAHEFIEKLQDGYDTLVGERGVKLSGGQRQRIAIARALLKKNAPVLVMDEATSSLDSISEQYIQESLDILKENRTTIVIAHRLSTITKMDRIIVLDDGEIVEQGSHEELLAHNGYYARLWESQVDGIIPE